MNTDVTKVLDVELPREQSEILHRELNLHVNPTYRDQILKEHLWPTDMDEYDDVSEALMTTVEEIIAICSKKDCAYFRLIGL